MDEQQKKKAFWLAVIILIVIGVLFFFLVIRDKNNTEIEAEGDEGIPEFQVPSANIKFDPELPPVATNAEFSAINLAKNYVERLGSWSTDNQLHNLEELIPLSSAKMRINLDSVEADYSNDDFSGITTKSLTTEVLSMDEKSAEIIVGTQRIATREEKSKKGVTENVYTQEAKVSLIKSGNTWLVDEVEWQ
ncbi:hypothetical protein HON36_06075 [Candidatus Parcubacteria bacterium]|jgi:hypothetical protein|nr:hypothetical protein [Candidatus Parcubacteria bacterium]MBT7228466.1 hypothetical protein [Candidatus Parcubacteria bacterium]